MCSYLFDTDLTSLDVEMSWIAIKKMLLIYLFLKSKLPQMITNQCGSITI